MAIYLETAEPKKLLNTFKKAIDDGHVVTWSTDSDGDFTHATEQWRNVAWFRPSVIDNKRLIFAIIKPKNKPISTEVYAIYHGRLAESLLAHCDYLFTKMSITAMASAEDFV